MSSRTSRASRSPVTLPVASSRETSVSRVSGVTSYGNGVVVPNAFTDRLLWTYILVALVVWVILALIVRERYVAVHAWARVPTWMGNPFVFSVAVIVSLVLAAYATYTGHRMSSRRSYSMAIISGFFLSIGVLLIIVAWLVYRTHSFTAAFWVALLALVLGVLHLYAVWSVYPWGVYAVLPLAALLTFVVYWLWRMAEEAYDHSDTGCCGDFAGPSP